jgi:hypothetical protein
VGSMVGLGFGTIGWFIGKVSIRIFGDNISKVPPPAITICPSCGSLAPRARLPRTMRQFLWGGWTCGNCLLDVDPWKLADPGNYADSLESRLGDSKKQ